MQDDCTERTNDEPTPYLAAIDDRDAVFSEIENFAWLAITHIHTERENGRVWHYLPYLMQGDPRWRGRKVRQVAKKYSLFAIIQVNAGHLYRGRYEGGKVGDTPSHKNRKHRVRGHFRLQAYGPNWSKRRLRWFKSHDRGSDDIPAPIPLYKLTADRPVGLAA